MYTRFSTHLTTFLVFLYEHPTLKLLHHTTTTTSTSLYTHDFPPSKVITSSSNITVALQNFQPLTLKLFFYTDYFWKPIYFPANTARGQGHHVFLATIMVASSIHPDHTDSGPAYYFRVVSKLSTQHQLHITVSPFWARFRFSDTPSFFSQRCRVSPNLPRFCGLWGGVFCRLLALAKLPQVELSLLVCHLDTFVRLTMRSFLGPHFTFVGADAHTTGTKPIVHHYCLARRG